MQAIRSYRHLQVMVKYCWTPGCSFLQNVTRIYGNEWICCPFSFLCQFHRQSQPLSWKSRKKSVTMTCVTFYLSTISNRCLIPYVFWCQTLKRILCQLVAGHWIKKPIILDLRQKWTNYLQSDLDEIWSQLQPKNWWMNNCRHTHKCTGNVPGHITGAGVFSSAPSHTWISSSQNRGKRGRRAERVTCS